MTQSQAIYRKNLLAKIHTHAEHKRIAAAGAWADWLGYRFGVGSAAGLSISELEHVLAVFGGRISDELNLTPDTLGRNLVANARAKKARIRAKNSAHKSAKTAEFGGPNKPAAAKIPRKSVQKPTEFARAGGLNSSRKTAEFSDVVRSNSAGNLAEFTAKITPRQFNKILAMSGEMGWSWARLSKFIIHQTKIIVGDPATLARLSSRDATKIITGLAAVAKTAKFRG